jgi:tripartite ATP-independent transporter DctP family solute receptor
MKTTLTRRTLLAAGTALPLCGILSSRGSAAEFSYRFATGQDPTHPNNTRAQEAIDRIRTASGGRIDMKLFPFNQLGSDTDLLSQVRSGGVDFFTLAASILSTFVPVTGIVNTGFAFPDYATVWKAMDGSLGQYIRAQVNKSGIVSVSKIMDNGFRQITASTKPIVTPADLRGFKLRVPPAPMLTSLFQALGAGPAPINFNEVYSALQTKVVEGEENGLAIIATARLYEVQKFCSMTSHVWDGYLTLGNRASWAALPKDLQEIVTREIDRSADDQRADVAKLDASLRQTLTGKGLVFNDPDKALFRDALAKTSFYGDWKKKYGEEAWGLLETYTGKLV